jgi:hypothetical protein
LAELNQVSFFLESEVDIAPCVTVAFPAALLHFGVMGAPPERPGDDMGGFDAPLGELDGDAMNFLDRPADQECLIVARRDIAFFRRHDIGVMTDDSHHGEGEHDERDMAVPAMPGAGLVVMAVPAMPGAGLVVIETELVLGSLEAVLDGAAAALDR